MFQARAYSLHQTIQTQNFLRILIFWTFWGMAGWFAATRLLLFRKTLFELGELNSELSRANNGLYTNQALRKRLINQLLTVYRYLHVKREQPWDRLVSQATCTIEGEDNCLHRHRLLIRVEDHRWRSGSRFR